MSAVFGVMESGLDPGEIGKLTNLLPEELLDLWLCRPNDPRMGQMALVVQARLVSFERSPLTLGDHVAADCTRARGRSAIGLHPVIR
ncbi:hypothetical protein [Hyphomicrobium sp. DY-1]|uniref:hypothetical protein n=1 Tax=Hyphomicrobium sp. DY-1 TaxID=3075650 RepID=UPI0039C22273